MEKNQKVYYPNPQGDYLFAIGESGDGDLEVEEKVGEDEGCQLGI